MLVVRGVGSRVETPILNYDLMLANDVRIQDELLQVVGCMGFFGERFLPGGHLRSGFYLEYSLV